MLPHVIRFNGGEFGTLVSRLAGRHRRRQRLSAIPTAAIDGLADFVAQLAGKAGLPERLSRVRRRAAQAARTGRRGRQAVDRQLQSA